MEAKVLETPRRRRLSQPERSAATRRELVDSTIETLVQLGYQNATTAEISERAGLSRGAHLHHFQTRATLFAATAAALAERAERDFGEMLERLQPGAGRRKAALDGLWQLFNGPVFQAVLELSANARTDAELAEPLDQAQRAYGRDAIAWLRRALEVGREQDDLLGIVLAAIRGLAVLRVLEPGDDAEARWRRARAWLLAMLEERVRAARPANGAAAR